MQLSQPDTAQHPKAQKRTDRSRRGRSIKRPRDTETAQASDRIGHLSCRADVFSMGHMMWGWPVPAAMKDNHVAMGMLQMLLTIIIMVINQKFFVSGFTSLLHGAPNMDTLVALGAGASFGYSTYALFAMTGAQVRGDMDAVMGYMHEFYFESAAMILTLITVGKCSNPTQKAGQPMP